MDTALRREWEESKILSRDKEKEGAGMKIYILEQEEGLAAMTAYGLETEREDVETFREPDRLEEKAEQETPDLIILYKGSGDAWAGEQLGSLKSGPAASVPVIVIAKEADEREIVRGLDGGADLFLHGPVSVVELYAYIHAVVRRIEGADAKSGELRAGSLRILPEHHQVFAGGQEIDLLPSEFILLEFLIRNEGCVMDNRQIAGGLKRDGRRMSPGTVKIRINALRKKLPDGKNMIHTVRGVGYRFEVEK